MIEKDKVEGKIEIVKNGHAYLIIENDEDLFIHRDNLGHALDNDIVRAEVVLDKSGKGNGFKGIVYEIVERHQTEFSGIIDVDKNKRLAFVRPSDGKVRVDFYIPIDKLNGAKNGDLVIVRLHRWYKKNKCPNGIILKVLGQATSHEAEMENIMFKHNIDYSFPEEVETEANAIPIEIPEKEILKRRDMRDILTITIDPESAKDFDDAISFKPLENGNYEIGVHIADVTHYIKPGSELDKEAYSRATSVYLVDRCIPMLPERLSNGICSLRPNEDKLTFSVIFEIDYNGKVVKHKFKKTVINSDFRYTYEEAQDIIDTSDYTRIGDGSLRFQSQEAIIILNKIAKKIRAQRFEDGAVTFNRREPQFVLDSSGTPTDVFFHESADSHQLIEEYMLLANRYVATYAYGLTKPYVYRTHDLPSEEKLAELSVFVEQFGYSFNTSGSIEQTKTSLNEMLKKAQGSGESNMIETLAIRSMSKAIYSTQIIGHYGLGFKHYSHFTSPIRRYPDVLAHRLLFDYLNGKNANVSRLGIQCDHCSDMENKAVKAQRESIKFKQCEYLKGKIGETFKGIISSVTNFGIFVEIIENGCEGLVSKETLSENNIFIDEENYCINNFDNMETYRLGDEIMVQVAKVDMNRKNIDFDIII